MIQSYFNAERVSAAILVIIGLLAICIAAWGWRNGAFWRGAAIAMLAMAVIQISVGATILVTSPKQAQSMARLIVVQKSLAVKDEISRMQSTLKGFSIYLSFELGLLLIGLFIFSIASSDGFWRGFAIALLIQTAVVLTSDFLAVRRAYAYLTWLNKI